MAEILGISHDTSSGIFISKNNGTGDKASFAITFKKKNRPLADPHMGPFFNGPGPVEPNLLLSFFVVIFPFVKKSCFFNNF
jgi:hypothetical protein